MIRIIFQKIHIRKYYWSSEYEKFYSYTW